MQWNINELENWEELRVYVDTALLPLYLYRQDQPMTDQVWRMNYLWNVAVAIEQRLKGRMLLFPLHYHFGSEQSAQQTPEGFENCVILHFQGEPIRLAQTQGAARVLMLPVGDEDLDSSLRFEVTVDVLYKEVIRHWQKKSAQ